jgi:ubiquinone/menaquinone biosynthesis C-methylase UbiE
MDKPSKREIVNEYDNLGGRLYDIRYSEEQESKYKLIIERIIPEKADLVLDLGCGTGLLMSKINAHYVGLDISKALISKALSKNHSNSFSELVYGDADNLPFRDSVFNIIYAVTLIQNTPNPLTTITEMIRVSKKDSKLVITALKKAFSLDRFKSILTKAGLVQISFAEESFSKDWIALVISWKIQFC